MGDADQVEVEDLTPPGRIGLRDGAGVLDAGAVDEHVQALSVQLGDGLGQRGVVGQVGLAACEQDEVVVT